MNGPRVWFANLRVWKKLLLGFVAVMVLMGTASVIVYLHAGRVEALTGETRDAIDNVMLANALDLALTDRVADFRDYLLSGESSALDSYNAATLRFEQAEAELRQRIDDPRQLAEIDSIVRIAAEWEEVTAGPGIALRQRSLQLDGPPVDSIVEFFRDFGRRGAARSRVEIDRFRAGQDLVMAISRERRDDAIAQIRTVTVLSTLLGLGLSVLLAIGIAGVIARDLNDAVDFAGDVSQGNLTRQISVPGRDEVGTLIGTLNRMVGDIRETISGVSGSATQVATAAEQIAASSEEISFTADKQVRSTEETSSSMEEIAAQIARVARSTESLAASVEETSTSVTEMSSSIEQTATNSDTLGASVEQTSATIEEMVASITQVGRHVEETREIAKTAEGDARTGGDAVDSTIRGMRRIHAEMEALTNTVKQLGRASASIGRISEVIEDIADQTNLLALNASIEAARAGEHGRGFSVVAQEIRRLAERSVESTREIGQTVREVIDDMEDVVKSSGEVAERTDEGIRLADSAGGALEKIIGSAGRTRELMEEVALSTQQQIGAATQAQEAMQHIQQVAYEVRIATREQANGSRQIAEAMENMNHQTREVFAATSEQKKGGEMVLEATEQISQGARATQEAIQEMTRAAQELSSQANRLTQLVSTFRV
jgi:methyl-accepting chemotaxis protein